MAFRQIKTLGEGAFGVAILAVDVKTNQPVVLKKTRITSSLRLNKQINALKALQHPNVLKLLDVIQQKDQLILVLEYVDKNLLIMSKQLSSRGQSMQEDQVRNLSFQILIGLCYVHSEGFIHRDIKPQNIAVDKSGLVKLIDFGIAKDIRSEKFTQYVSTRYYRAPENILLMDRYDQKVDVWAFGCLLAELILLRPLFEGNSSVDQLFKIIQILGSQQFKNWKQGSDRLLKQRIVLKQTVGLGLQKIVRGSYEFLKVLKRCLKVDPAERAQLSQIAQEQFFKSCKGQLPIKKSSKLKEKQAQQPQADPLEEFEELLRAEKQPVRHVKMKRTR